MIKTVKYCIGWLVGRKQKNNCFSNVAPQLAMPRRWRTVLKENKAEKIP
jgi:hypothetical protein